jgi:hypothetical protein
VDALKRNRIVERREAMGVGGVEGHKCTYINVI